MNGEKILRKRIQEILQASMLELDPLANIQPLEFNQDEILTEPDEGLIDETDDEENLITNDSPRYGHGEGFFTQSA